MALISNKCTEKDLREYLTKTGYYGRSAQFLKLELAALERPGWVQVFEFHVRVKEHDGPWTEHFGLCRTDERHDVFEVQMFSEEDRQRQTLRHDACEMITHERGERHWTFKPLMMLFGVLLCVAIVGALLSNRGPVTTAKAAVPEDVMTQNSTGIKQTPETPIQSDRFRTDVNP